MEKVIRRIDDLGRVVITKAIRRELHVQEGDGFEQWVNERGNVEMRRVSEEEVENYLKERMKEYDKSERNMLHMR